MQRYERHARSMMKPRGSETMATSWWRLWNRASQGPNLSWRYAMAKAANRIKSLCFIPLKQNLPNNKLRNALTSARHLGLSQTWEWSWITQFRFWTPNSKFHRLYYSMDRGWPYNYPFTHVHCISGSYGMLWHAIIALSQPHHQCASPPHAIHPHKDSHCSYLASAEHRWTSPVKGFNRLRLVGKCW